MYLVIKINKKPVLGLVFLLLLVTLLHYYTILLLHYYIIIVSQYYIDAIKWIKLKKAIKKLRLADQSNYGSVSNSVGDQK